MSAPDAVINNVDATIGVEAGAAGGGESKNAQKRAQKEAGTYTTYIHTYIKRWYMCLLYMMSSRPVGV
jgi:hypothetical protein